MQIRVNGQPLETHAPTLAALLAWLQIPSLGTAVAVNQVVVRRALHAECDLQDGDEIEIIRAVQGG